MEQLIRSRLSMCGVPIDLYPDSPSALAGIEEKAFADSGNSPAQVNFINAHVVNTAIADPELMAILAGGVLNLADGAGIWLGGRILAGIEIANLNGTDFGLKVLEWGAARGLRFYFLGAKDGIAKTAKEKLCARIPGLRVEGAHSGYLDPQETDEVIHSILDAGTDILFVCMGVPNQEKWIHRHLSALHGVKAIFGLGAFFDFYAEAVRRAPLWMIKARIEWVYRLYQEPKRLWRRYLLGNFIFLKHILAYKMAHSDGHHKKSAGGG